MANIIKSQNLKALSGKHFKKGDELVFSQLSLTPIQHDIFALFLSRLEKENWQDYLIDGDLRQVPTYEFSNELLSSWFNTDKQKLSSTLKKPCRSLSKVSIGVRKENKDDFGFLPLFSDINYERGTLSLTPNYRLINAFIAASGGYSLIPHQVFRELHLEYSKRLYTIICRFKNHGKLRAFSLNDLHGYFGLLDENGKLSKKTYAVTGNFMNRIIKPAIKEIAEKDQNVKFAYDSDSGNFGFKYQKEGKKVIGLEFLFNWNDEKEINPQKLLGYPDAINTYKDVMSGIDIEYTKEVLDNAIIHCGQLSLDPQLDFEVDVVSFMQKLSDLKSQLPSE